MKFMKQTNVDLEMLIKCYAKHNGENGIFLSILEYDDGLASLLKLSHDELNELVYGYVYLSDFSDKEEARTFFERIENESHPDAQYTVLVENGEIAKEFPHW